MTSVFAANGENISVTVIEAGPCVVTQVKSVETDGYRAVQLAFGDKKEKNTTKPMQGHFKKANTTGKRALVEFRDFKAEYDGLVELGKEIKVQDIFVEGDFLDAVHLERKRLPGCCKALQLSGSRWSNPRSA